MEDLPINFDKSHLRDVINELQRLLIYLLQAEQLMYRSYFQRIKGNLRKD